MYQFYQLDETQKHYAKRKKKTQKITCCMTTLMEIFRIDKSIKRDWWLPEPGIWNNGEKLVKELQALVRSNESFLELDRGGGSTTLCMY